MFPALPQNFTNSGQMPISGGDAKSGNGDSTFNNHTKFGGIDYNKGIPNWAIFVGLGLAAIWVFTSAKR